MLFQFVPVLQLFFKFYVHVKALKVSPTENTAPVGPDTPRQ